MLIPPQFLAAGGAIALVGGFMGGWIACDWKRDSEDLHALKKSTAQIAHSADRIDQSAAKYEQEKPDANARSTQRESTIREIYHDRVVPSDCAAPDTVVRVLNDAVADANARAAGKPAAGLPTPANGPKPAD